MTKYVHTSRVHPHPANIRASLGDLTELTDSIRAQGILQPLVVRQHPDLEGHYQVLAGHRRLAAAQAASRDQVPVVVRPITGTSQAAGATAVMLAENLIRADLSAVEKAEAIGSLRDGQGLSAAQIAKLTGLTCSTIGYYLSLLDLDDASLARVASGAVAVGDAIAAVRQAHAAARGRPRGPGGQPKVSVPDEHFSYRHPLAGLARAMCEAAGHTAPKTGQGRPGEGKVACGGCWEAVIRADERGHTAAQAAR